jgi:class 3 adenylate cyclase
MRRKAGLFLLAVILSVTLVATFVVSFQMYRFVSQRQADEIHALEHSLGNRFDTFIAMLRSEQNRIARHMETVLPQIAAELEASGRRPQDLSIAELDALARKYDVQNIYFIDRTYKVFQTNLASDMNLQFPTDGQFRKFLDSVFGRNKVMTDGIDMSSLTGTLRTYSYLGPAGKDYILETSTEVRTHLAGGEFGWMSKFFFEDFLADAERSNPYVKHIDMFLVNDAGYWSLLNVGRQLAPEIAHEVDRNGVYDTAAADGRLVTVYRRYGSSGPALTDDPVAPKLVISMITYDTGPAREVVMHVLTVAAIVLALALPVVFWIASRLLQRQLLDPLFNLRREAMAIAGGNLDQGIADTARSDEIGHLAASFDRMRDAVRQTILDLKRTNLSIERFVPRAFLEMIGKPSIVEVELGDNIRKEMTILFSDIRSFTTLSEAMTPDDNFAFINRYLECMGPVIRAHNGFIDKYIGDAIMALFESADDAVRASLAMVETLDGYNARRRAAGRAPIAIGVGINTGSLMLGTIGESHRMDGTVISDAVNLASRVESLTKTYRLGILISQYTRDRLASPGKFDIREVDTVTVKGKTQPVSIFQVHGWAEAKP